MKEERKEGRKGKRKKKEIEEGVNLLTSLLRIIKYQELKLHHFMRKEAETHEGDKEVIAGE